MKRPVALVTGGSRGIGRAIVEELAPSHRVAVTYNSNHSAAEGVAAATGARFFHSNIADLAASARLVPAIEAELGPIDLLVNNAGIGPRERRDILEATPESFDELIAINLRGPYFLTQQVARAMSERRRGRIVFVSSISSFAVHQSRRILSFQSGAEHGRATVCCSLSSRECEGF